MITTKEIKDIYLLQLLSIFLCNRDPKDQKSLRLQPKELAFLKSDFVKVVLPQSTRMLISTQLLLLSSLWHLVQNEKQSTYPSTPPLIAISALKANYHILLLQIVLLMFLQCSKERFSQDEQHHIFSSGLVPN